MLPTMVACMKLKLKIETVEQVKPAAKDVIVWDTDLKGFGLKVTPKGIRSFFLYYRTKDHKQRRPKIGDFPSIQPEKARKIAKQWLAEVLGGGDPSAANKANRASRGEGLMLDLFAQYKLHKKLEGRRSVAEIQRIFAHDILPEFGKRKPEEISVHEVSRFLDKIAVRSPSVAWAVRRQLSAFYSWAISRLPPGATNPVTNASRPPKVKARERVLTDAELILLWRVVDREREPWRTALKLLILTGQRREEVLAADWNEIDLAARVWIIPGNRAKNGKAHIVPLAPAVIQLLKLLPTTQGRLFPTGTGIVSRAAKRIKNGMGDSPSWTWHDIRRTFATGLQRLDVRLEVTEAILNHISGSRAGIVGLYQRHDWAQEKRDALMTWAGHVLRMVEDKQQTHVAKVN